VCDECCVRWPQAAVPETAVATDLYAFSKAAAIFADRLHTVGGGSKDASRAWTDATQIRACKRCDAASADARQALLSGITVREARQKIVNEWKNVNFWRPFPKDFHMGGLCPVHAAACSGSLPLLRWLLEEFSCPVAGAFGLTAGDPPKSVLRVAVEHAATEILEFLITADLPTHDLPLKMSHDLDVRPQVALRALEAALRDSHKLRDLVDSVLESSAREHQERESQTLLLLSESQRSQASAPPYFDSLEADRNECVVCFTAIDPAERCALVPCGHTACCNQCAGTLTACPICRASVTHAMKIFVE